MILMDNAQANDLVMDIIKQAIKDFEFGLRYMNIEPKNYAQERRKNLARVMMNDAKAFFHSKYFGLMCGEIDGDLMMHRIIEHHCNYSCSILCEESALKRTKRKHPLNFNDFVT